VQPKLTFACELDPDRLAALFAGQSVIQDLLALRARVALMLSDFTDKRAEVVRRLNSAGIPVVAIPLLPLAQGYYFTADNTDQAARRYEEWQTWTRTHDLAWDGVGLDIEPDARIRTVMKTLGHSQIALTMNTYTHVLPDIERAAVDGAAETIFGVDSRLQTWLHSPDGVRT